MFFVFFSKEKNTVFMIHSFANVLYLSLYMLGILFSSADILFKISFFDFLKQNGPDTL